MSKNNDKKEKITTGEDLPRVEQELSQVASNPKQNMLILLVIFVAFLYLLFNLFVSGESSEEEEPTPAPTEVEKPVAFDDSDIPSIPTLPAPPQLEDPTPPPPPPIDPIDPDASLPQAQNIEPALPEPPGELDKPILPISVQPKDDNARKRLEAKRKSSIILIGGVVPKKTQEQIQEEANFSFRGDMNLILGRGKVIDAIIETAVNTDIVGEIRAVINRDIYSEWGKNILLPKGSRVFGSYSTGINGSYGRISIEWTRIDLANGYRLNLSGTGIDALGRKGNQGRVDNKFKERFSNAVLRSAFNVVLAEGLDKLTPPQITSQAAANQDQVSSNIKNIANGIFTQTALTEATRRVQICASVLAAITDKTSTTFTQIDSACTSLTTDVGSTEAEKLNSLMSTINSSSDELIKNTNANIEETKAQAASKQAFTDISDVVKTLVEEQEFKPTITIDQGTPVKIYVNKDYKFPMKAVKRSRLIK